MNITEDILRLLPSDALTAEAGPAAGTPAGISVESLTRTDAAGAAWCFCIASTFDARVGA
ncbi:hypothetical protein KV205_16110 [Streptomyces sp. SKN60]|uniref:hypothetical protein n=1 Tax=Streptomyces sp. SKN60 TaxID=2855506 RepID=UPI002245B561|nr:hypothetical protein [Streptomyces sp. SKN60]MCX2182047.1 hypothetical protein [Streptomyces sp. SKN60]